MGWCAGDHVILRWTGHRDWVDEHEEKSRTGTFDEKPGLLQGWPHVVVADRDDLLVLWMPTGTDTQMRDLSDPEREMLRGGGGWRKDSLRLMFPGKRYSVSFDWPPDPEREFPMGRGRDLYKEDRQSGDERYRNQRSRPYERVPAHTLLRYDVNLHAPFVRTPIGIDTTHSSMHVVVAPDLTWHWKGAEGGWAGRLNEDALRILMDLDIYTAEDVEQFRVAGREMIAMVEARRFPFDGSYLDWQPPAEWTIPTAPDGWDVIPGYDFNHTTGRRIGGIDHERLKQPTF